MSAADMSAGGSSRHDMMQTFPTKAATWSAVIANSCSWENVDVVLYWTPSMKDMKLMRQAA